MIVAPFSEYQSKGNAVNSTVTLDMPSDVTYRPHVFVGLTFTDDNGVTATPGAGTFSLSAETLNNPGVYTPLYNATSISATAALTTYSAAGNITKVRLVTDSITTATKVNVKVTANAS